ncbi:putative C-14 sterol reductase [Xylariomycetidae sp. FL2044]|nr:putative C-14 sterol reductase [Xylariomycetidae sp. FL2044]
MSREVTPPRAKPSYEFGGPIGAAGIVFGLPVLLWTFYFACNDVSGCPAPSLLNPRALSWDTLKAEIGWPAGGLRDFVSWKATAAVFGYHLFSLILWKVLPAHETRGTKLKYHDRPLEYRWNAFSSTLVHFAICAVGTYLQGANFVAWTFMTDNYLQILTINILFAYAISVFVYIRSFSVDTNYPNKDLRELADGGRTGNLIYDFYIGRELNPRVTLPFFGVIDIKTFLEMRPGLTGWILLDMAFIAKQYRTYGFVSDSIIFTTCAQLYYVLDGQYLEYGITTMMDIATDGLGFMLTFGDIVWVPFLYSTQCRYLSVYPVELGWLGIAGLTAVCALGLYIFRAANTQKNTFRNNPEDPAVAKWSYIQTKRGTKLLTSGWWGWSRHINYFGDWLQASPFSFPTGVAGYLILTAGSLPPSSDDVYTMADGRQVVQGAARGWGIIFTYFYVLYFAVLLIHREGRDDAQCAQKYGDDWTRYKKIVRWKILPFVY